MGKAGFEGLQCLVDQVNQLLDNKKLDAARMSVEYGIGLPAARRRLKLLAQLRGAIVPEGNLVSVRLSPRAEGNMAGDGAVAAACLVSSLASALHDTPSIGRNVGQLRDAWVARGREAHPIDSLDRKFWFVVRGGEKALPKAEVRLEDVVRALLDEREITFDYVHFDGRPEKRLVAQPLTLALHEHQFYVIGRQRDRAPHPFRFARMSSVRVGKRAAYPTDGEYHPRQLFRNAFGIFVGNANESAVIVKLRFAPHWRHYIDSHRWHDSQTARIPHKDGSVDVTLDVRVCHELKAWIRGFGPDVEVLAPASLREEIAATIEKAAAIYKGPAKAAGLRTPARAPIEPAPLMVNERTTSRPPRQRRGPRH